MKTINTNMFRKSGVERQVMFLVEAAVLFGLLFLYARFAPTLHPVTIALIWTVLTAAVAWLDSYHMVFDKCYKQEQFKSGGLLSKVNGGRLIALLKAFVLSAICMGSLLFDIPKWGLAEWCVTISSAPLFLVVSFVVVKVMDKEFEKPYQESKSTFVSCVATVALLCYIYAIIASCQSTASYNSAIEAFTSVKQPFECSPSALMSQVGMLVALADGLTAYTLPLIGETSFPVYVVFRVALIVSTFAGIVKLLGACSLPRQELRKAFLPIAAIKNQDDDCPLVKSFVAIAILLALCPAAMFFYFESTVSNAVETEEYTAIEKLVRNEVGVAACVIDGIPYDPIAVQEAMQEMSKRSENLAEWKNETLIPLINETYNARLANVDSYLDWYYSLPADYERLAQLVTGSVEDYVKEQFTAEIDNGIDDSQLSEEMSRFFEECEAIRADYSNALSQYAIKDVPEWLLIKEGATTFDISVEPLGPTQELVDWRARMGIGAASGSAAGITSKVLTEKVAKKAFFSKAVGRFASAVGSRGAGAAVGGSVGTFGGPLGTAVGVVVGTGVGIGADYGMLKIDELQNREEYKAEIVEAIEEARAETLAIVQIS